MTVLEYYVPAKRNRWLLALHGGLTLVLSLGIGSCASASGGNANGGVRDAGAGVTGDATSSGCSSDAECIRQLPETTPPECATATCNVLAGVCAFVAKDQDGDGHASNNCKSNTPGITIQVGDDCNDSDPSLYPGHQETCTVTDDGGAATGMLCAPGHISCLADGTQSTCQGMVACTNRACVGGSCAGMCTPGTTTCATDGSNGLQTCMPDGTWGVAVTCGMASCVATEGGAQCTGTCAAGDTMCGGNNGVQTCSPTGTWGDPVACVNQTCIGGVCSGSCAPGQTQCSGNAVATCTATGALGTPVDCSGQTCVLTTTTAGDGGGSASIASCQGSCVAGQKDCDESRQQPRQCGTDGQWEDVGSACSGSTPECNAGACVACSPGAYGCSGAQPQQCDTSGSWQSRGSTCTGLTPACLNGACVVCTPGTMQCANSLVIETCGPAGAWEGAVACPVDQTCINGTCTGACGQGQTRCGPPAYYSGGQPTLVSCDTTGQWSNPASYCGGESIWQQCCGGACCVCSPPDDGGVSECVLDLVENTSAAAVAVDSTSVYWTENYAGNVMKEYIGGGTPITLVSGLSSPYGIAVDATNVYFVDYPAGTVLSAPLIGGTPTTLASVSGGNPYGIAVDANNAYWTDYKLGTVMKVPLGGGAATTLASGRSEPEGIAVNGTGVYWTDALGNDVMSVPLGGGTPTTLASNQSEACSIAVNATDVYWVNCYGGDVLTVPAGGGTVTTLATGQNETMAIAIDSTSAYWTNNGAGVSKVALDGGAPYAYPTSYGGSSIAVGATSVFFTGSSLGFSGPVLQVTPK